MTEKLTSKKQKSSFDLNVAACRLILIIIPILDLSTILRVENGILINCLFTWARNEKEPLRSYATGLIAATTVFEDNAIEYREQNNVLVRILLKRLDTLQEEMLEAQKMNAQSECDNKPFLNLRGSFERIKPKLNSPTTDDEWVDGPVFHNETLCESPSEKFYENNLLPIYPPTIQINQMFILQYLQSIAKHQEVRTLCHNLICSTTFNKKKIVYRTCI